MKVNPYYDPEKLGLTMISFEDPNAHYSFNTLCFWSDGKGNVYSARDSGCSCPTPFEDYEGETQNEVVQKLEKVGSINHAESIFDDYKKCIEGQLPLSDKINALKWVECEIVAKTKEA